jgi:hypothetical protein
MAKTATEILTAIVDLLTPLASEERQRVIGAALVLLGENTPALSKNAADMNDDESVTLPPKARQWVKQNGLTQDMLDQVFHLDNGAAEVLAEAPGKSQKEKTINAYILAGVSQFLINGESRFSDKLAREICSASGCFSSTNHATYLKDKGSDFTGTRESGWLLTSPGLKRGAALVKLIAGSQE